MEHQPRVIGRLNVEPLERTATELPALPEKRRESRDRGGRHAETDRRGAANCDVLGESFPQRSPQVKSSFPDQGIHETALVAGRDQLSLNVRGDFTM